jgi:hypothetical protein
VLCPCLPKANIRTSTLSYLSASIASVHTWVNSSRELQMLATVTAVVSLLTHTSYPSRVAPISLPKPTLLPLLLSTLLQTVTPSNSFSLPSLDLMLSTCRPPLHLQLSQHKRIHALRTVSEEGDSASVSPFVAALKDAYTDVDLFKRFLEFVGTNWMMLALMNWCIISVVKLHVTSLPLVPPPVAS